MNLVNRCILFGSAIALCAGCAPHRSKREELATSACPPALPEYGPERSPLASLKDAGVIPLCALPSPRGADFTLRYTTFLFSSHGTYSYQARHGRLTVAIEDAANYDPPFRWQRVLKLPAATFHDKLKNTGIDDLWSADDPDCDPGTTVIAEFGSVLEFQDASGYHARHSPRVQAKECATPYSRIFRAVNDLVGDLENLPPMP